MGEVKIDQATLEKQEGNLSEDQNAAIALEAIADIQKEKKPDEPESKEKEEKAEDAPKEETEPTAEELATKEQEAKVKEEERILNAKEEELSEEDKVKKVEIVKVKDEAKLKTAETEIADYAKEHSISQEEARADLESIAKIQEKYKGDAKQLAKANLHLQRLYSKTEEEAKALKEAKPSVAQEVTVEAVEKFIEDGKVVVNGKNVTKEQTIEAYRNAYPDLTEDMADDKVLKLAAKEYKQQIDKNFVEQNTQISAQAREKRNTLFDTVSEADKKFIPVLKPLIEKLSDSQIMHENFSVNTYITYAKGQEYDTLSKKFEDDKKAFGEKEYKRGLEEAKILGIKKPVGSGGNSPKGKNIVLTEEQKKRAHEMFDNPDITTERAEQLYAEHLKEIDKK